MAWSVTRGVALLGLVAGCSSSGGGVEVRPTFVQLGDGFDAILADGAQLDYTNPATLPISGSTSYQGVLGLDSDGSGGAPASMAGQMTLVADFGGDAVSGSVTNLVTDTEQQLGGSLSIHDGIIDPSADVALEYTYAFDLDGTLTDGQGRDLDVSAQGFGDFLGVDHQQALGVVDGTITTPTGAAIAAGGFVAER